MNIVFQGFFLLYSSTLVVMVPSPSLSKSWKASLNSATCSSVSFRSAGSLAAAAAVTVVAAILKAYLHFLNVCYCTRYAPRLWASFGTHITHTWKTKKEILCKYTLGESVAIKNGVVCKQTILLQRRRHLFFSFDPKSVKGEERRKEERKKERKKEGAS